MRRLAFVILIVGTLTGCASMKAWYVHRETQDVAHCRAIGWGWLGTPMAVYRQNQCETALKERGFVEVSEDGAKLAVQQRCAQMWPNDPANSAICLDEEMKKLRGKLKFQ